MIVRQESAPIIVIGGGLAGLTAALEAKRQGRPVMVLEAGKQVTGLAASHSDTEGFTYDTGAHFVTNRLAAAIGAGAVCRDVEYYGETVWRSGREYSYPFGLMRVPRYAGSAIAARLHSQTRAPLNAQEWFEYEYGRNFAREVALPLVQAWSGCPPSELSPEVGSKIPGGILHTMRLRIAARLRKKAIAIGYCREQRESSSVWHVYPDDGVAALCNILASHVQGHIHLSTPVQRIYVDGDRVVGVRAADRDHGAAAVVSTVPINLLPKLVEGTAQLERYRSFRFRPMIFVNLRLRGRRLLPDTVVWTPDGEFPFFRLTEAPRSMPWLAPHDKTLITADIGTSTDDPLWRKSDEELGQLCLEAIRPIVPDASARYLGCHVLRIPIAYPVFHLSYEQARRELAISTGVNGLISVGRNGEFGHWLMEDVFWRTTGKVREWLRHVPPLRAGTSC